MGIMVPNKPVVKEGMRERGVICLFLFFFYISPFAAIDYILDQPKGNPRTHAIISYVFIELTVLLIVWFLGRLYRKKYPHHQ